MPDPDNLFEPEVADELAFEKFPTDFSLPRDRYLQLEIIRANRAKWVEALRSGHFEQASGALCAGVGFCCLGVAEALAHQGEVWERLSTSRPFRVPSTSTESVLTQSTQKLLGFASADPVLRLSDASTASCLNDGEGYTFNDIATLVESLPVTFDGSMDQMRRIDNFFDELV